MVRLAPLFVFITSVLLLVSVGCGGGQAPTYPSDIIGDEGVSRFIRADLGGTIEAYGARLYIPPGALPADTEITLRIIPPGLTVGGVTFAGGVEILPHLVDLRGPVLMEFPIVPGVFPACTFPHGQTWSNGKYVPLYFRDGTPSYAMISDDGTKAMLSTDHFSVFMLVMDQVAAYTDDTDVLFSRLRELRLKNGSSLYYQDDILINDRMKYYLGGWGEVYGSEKWLWELFDFVQPGEVYDPNTRYDLYREIFGDLLFMKSFADRYNSSEQSGSFVYYKFVPTLVNFFRITHADSELGESWVKVGPTNDYYHVMDLYSSLDGYDFLERVAQAEAARCTAVSNALDAAIADGDISGDLAQVLNTYGLRLSGSVESDFNLFMRLSAARAIVEMNCEAMEALCNQMAFTDATANTAARSSIAAARQILHGGDQHFTDIVVQTILSNPSLVSDQGEVSLSQLLGAYYEEGKDGIGTSLSYGAVFAYFIQNGFSEHDALLMANKATSLDAGHVTYGLEQCMADTYKWDPAVFVRDLQRATLAGTVAGELMKPQLIENLEGEADVASVMAFGKIMRADLGYIYSRLKYDSWAYIVLSDEKGSYDWLGENTPWQEGNILMEFDPQQGRHFRTESLRHLNENIYSDVVTMIEELQLPVPYTGPGIDITIE